MRYAAHIIATMEWDTQYRKVGAVTQSPLCPAGCIWWKRWSSGQGLMERYPRVLPCVTTKMCASVVWHCGHVFATSCYSSRINPLRTSTEVASGKKAHSHTLWSMTSTPGCSLKINSPGMPSCLQAMAAFTEVEVKEWGSQKNQDRHQLNQLKHCIEYLYYCPPHWGGRGTEKIRGAWNYSPTVDAGPTECVGGRPVPDDDNSVSSRPWVYLLELAASHVS